jgi:uncharacterized protein YqeY
MIIEKIKADQLTARKTGDKIKAKSLTSIISDSTGAGVNAGVPKDEAVIAVIRKHLKGLKETKELLGAVTESNKERCIVNAEEILILEQYLPQTLTDDEVFDIITTNEWANIGVAMGLVKKEAAAQGKLFDGAQVQSVLRSIVTK